MSINVLQAEINFSHIQAEADRLARGAAARVPVDLRDVPPLSPASVKHDSYPTGKTTTTCERRVSR